MRNFFVLSLLGLLFASCELETSGNGHLDGFWQLCALDSLHNGKSVDMRQNGVFWAVQANLLEARSPAANVFFRFSHAGDSLLLSSPYINNRDSADIEVTDPALLRPLGVNRLDERFLVETLDGGTMVLRSTALRLYFRKY